MKNMYDKIYRKIHTLFLTKWKKGKFKWLFYPHLWSAKQVESLCMQELKQVYLTAEPNRGAGIGHQMDGWIAGYLYAKRWGIPYAYSGFSSADWDKVLGFGEQGPTVRQLVTEEGYKKRRLPYFNGNNQLEVQKIRNIIAAHSGKKVVFSLELDQFCDKQYEVAPYLTELFYHTDSRLHDWNLYRSDEINIAVHIRRGDILGADGQLQQQHQQRWLDNNYYLNVLDQILPLVAPNKYKIYLFSQGKEEDFSEFNKYENIEFCMELSSQDTFACLAKADILILGKSSFSFDAALIGNKIRICPKSFWGVYPDHKEWIVLEDDGTISNDQKIDISKLIEAQKESERIMI